MQEVKCLFPYAYTNIILGMQHQYKKVVNVIIIMVTGIMPLSCSALRSLTGWLVNYTSVSPR